MEFKVTDEIKKTASKVVEEYRKSLTSFGLRDSNLYNNCSVDVEFNGNKLQVSLFLEPYWKYVEYGRRPNQKRPPTEVIEKWITEKNICITPDPRTNKIPSTKSVAYVIARKIGRDGIPAKKPLTKTMYSNNMSNIIFQLKREIVKQLKDQLFDN